MMKQTPIASNSFDDFRKDILNNVKKIGERTIGPQAQQTDKNQIYPYEAIESLRKESLQALTVPTQYGGLGAGFKGDVVLLPLVLMELASWCSSTAQIFALHNSAVQYIHAYGTEKQQRFFFEEVNNGSFMASFGSETSRNGAIQSSLTPVQDGYLLNGKKIFATGSSGAKWALWRAVRIDKNEQNSKNFMMPFVNLSSPGVVVINDWDGMGQRGTGSGKVEASNVFIDKQHLIAEGVTEYKYDAYFSSMFHINFAAQFVGIAKGAFREALAYVKNHIKNAHDDAITQLRIGDLSAKIKAAEQIMYYAAKKLQEKNIEEDNWEDIELAAAQAKIISTETTLDVTNTIFQVMGARSATNELGFDRFYRNARTLTLHDRVDRQRQLAGKIELTQETIL